MPNLGRLLTAMVTPFTADGAVDHDRARALAQKLVDEGSDGLVVSGTTGESPTLTKDEKIALFKAVKEAVGDRATVVAGTGSYSTAETIALSQAAESAGVDALLLIAPYYNKPNQAGLLAHFSAVADAVSLPIILYNHPGRTGVTIEPATMVELAKKPNVVAVKDSSGSLDLATDYRRRLPADFALYSGDDPLTLAYSAIGGVGVISVSAHVAGREIKAMLDAWDKGDVAEARRLHLALYELHKVMFCAPSPAPVKFALAHRGFAVGGVRLPLLPLEAAEQAQVAKVLDSLALVTA
jgi:4-hydroxy-tetrahydrodipicolinate synthase